VPVAAIVTTGSGTSYVTVAGAGGKQTQVPVTPAMPPVVAAPAR
jgi:hypothetical protein